MDCEQPFDEEEVRLLLDGNDEEINQGFVLIDKYLRRPMCGHIRRYFPGLSSDDISELWQECLLALWKVIASGKFDLNKPLMPWVRGVAYKKAIDRLRRRTTYDQVVQGIADSLKGTEVGKVWARIDEVERQEVLRSVDNSIAQLPARQKLVMHVYAHWFPDTTSMEILRRRVSEMTGEEQTLASVKRALQEGRAKIRSILARKGYNPHAQGEEYVRL